MKISLTVGLILMAALFAMASSGENESLDAYLPFVETIHPYETFSSPGFEDPEGIFSRKNYRTYLQMYAHHYRRVFSLEEMEEIAAFYSSEVGEKFLSFHREVDVLSGVLAEVSSPREVWTCPHHPQIKSPDEGKCPTCQKELVPVNGDKTEPPTNGRSQ